VCIRTTATTSQGATKQALLSKLSDNTPVQGVLQASGEKSNKGAGECGCYLGGKIWGCFTHSYVSGVIGESETKFSSKS
jgi:hypothetical protein